VSDLCNLNLCDVFQELIARVKQALPVFLNYCNTRILAFQAHFLHTWNAPLFIIILPECYEGFSINFSSAKGFDGQTKLGNIILVNLILSDFPLLKNSNGNDCTIPVFCWTASQNRKIIWPWKATWLASTRHTHKTELWSSMVISVIRYWGTRVNTPSVKTLNKCNDIWVNFDKRNSLIMFPVYLKQYEKFLISNFRHVLNVVRFLLSNSPASEFYTPMFRNTVCSIFIGG
jgi:hypothetical protein